MTLRFRIDALRDNDWEPGRITFHPDTPMDALVDVAQDLACILRRPVRIVRVRETTLASIESVRVFDPTPDAA